MKYLIKQYKWLIIALVSITSIACEKDDSDAEFGNPTIYMPQATIAGGRYNVPAGIDSASYNYKIDMAGDKVNIILGVARSGEQSSEPYSVNVAINEDTVNQLLTNKTLDPATHQLLPKALYTVPSALEVQAGKTEATFFLSINKTQLKTFAGKRMVVALSLASPSRYSLNNAINKVIVIIDVNALKL